MQTWRCFLSEKSLIKHVLCLENPLSFSPRQPRVEISFLSVLKVNAIGSVIGLVTGGRVRLNKIIEGRKLKLRGEQSESNVLKKERKKRKKGSEKGERRRIERKKNLNIRLLWERLSYSYEETSTEINK